MTPSRCSVECRSSTSTCPRSCGYAKQQSLRVEICTNGYRIEPRLKEIASDLDLLRVSLEGIGASNDHIRKQGSYHSALSALECAGDLGVRSGATTTVNAHNINEALPLARTLQEFAVEELQLHQMRPVGNAAEHPELLVNGAADYARLRQQLQDANLTIDVIVDEDLSEYGAPEICAPAGGSREIARIEADLRGALTMSCKAVGKDSHAFWYDKQGDRIIYRPSTTDEITLAVPDVVDARAWPTAVREPRRTTRHRQVDHRPLLAEARGAVLVLTVPPEYQPLRRAVDRNSNTDARMRFYLSALLTATDEIQRHLAVGVPVVVERYFVRTRRSRPINQIGRDLVNSS
ncbi:MULTISPECIES: hypothetical protein [unclassified Streptomyces]|uniref:hypothetical protein n=1 Tax=unclassified Streptomyces TaxID=2593676 RepID=UPI0038086681